jgi:peptidoglycan/xylan/chitin deacetylase (PgdA/CDA1 family)
MSRHVKQRKALFSIAAGSLLVCIGFGVSVLRDLDVRSHIDAYRYLGYRYEYNRGNGMTRTSAALSVLDDTETLTPVFIGGSGIPVLLYHGIVPVADRFSITEKKFKEQMFALKRAGYRTITLDEFYDFMNGTTQLPEKSFLLTFDDGRIDSVKYADPIFRALGFHAVMFVATDASIPPEDRKESTYYIDQKDIREMLASGRWEVGSHAVQGTGGFVPIDAAGHKGNFLSNKMWLATEQRLETDAEYEARVTHELHDSKLELEKTFGITVGSMSYPFGDYGQQNANNPDAAGVINRIIGQNYRVAFRQVWPNYGQYILNYPSDDHLHLKRVETPTDWTGKQLIDYLAIGADKPLPYAESFVSDAGWKQTWGESELRDGAYALRATAKSTGAATFLEGAGAWTDYLYTAKVDQVSGSHVSLVGRYQDEDHYLACTFGQGRAKIDRVASDTTTKLAESKVRPSLLASGDFGMRIKGNTMQCLIGSNVVVSSYVPAGHGGIGIKIWDQVPATAEAIVKHVSVVPIE